MDNGTNGGFFEILLDYYIKSSRSFIVKDINQIINIPSLDPKIIPLQIILPKEKIIKTLKNLN